MLGGSRALMGNTRIMATPAWHAGKKRGRDPRSTPFQPPAKEPALDPPILRPPAEQTSPRAPRKPHLSFSWGPEWQRSLSSPGCESGPPLLPPCPPGTPPAPHPCQQGRGATAREEQAGEVAGGIKEALLPSPPPLPPFRGQNANGYFPPRPSWTALNASKVQSCLRGHALWLIL